MDKFRTFRVPSLDQNLTQVLHIYAFDGYNPLSLKRYNNYVDAMVKNDKLIDLAAIKYLPCEFIPGRSSELEKIGSLCVNKNYYQLAMLVNDFVVSKDEAETLEKTKEVDLKKIIVLEETPEQKISNNNDTKNNTPETADQVSAIDTKPGFWKFAVKTSQDAFLFLSQSNYPGWTAKIDGTPTKIYQADYLFQAVYVPAGEHTITFEFSSRPLIIGSILTIIGLSLVFAAIISYLRQRRNLRIKRDKT
jgi:hypothetical protein